MSPKQMVGYGRLGRVRSTKCDCRFRCPYVKSDHGWRFPRVSIHAIKRLALLGGGDMLSAETIRGPIQVRFSGILDAYNSDILDVNLTELAWLRTVGFGNNSLNIADSSNRGHSLRSTLWRALAAPLLVGIIVYA